MLLVIVAILLLIGNWFFTETLVFIPVDISISLGSFSFWVLTAIALSFIAWCISDD